MPVRLVVVSHTAHWAGPGGPVGWGPTIREIDQLARLFDEVVHVAPCREAEAPESSRPYRAANVRLVAVAPGGGPGALGKLDAFRHAWGWGRVIRRETADADVVHVRCPANIAAVALVVLALGRPRARRWYKYAGAWEARKGEPLSYRLQRWWLCRARVLHRGVVTVNGRGDRLPEHVHALSNPALTDDEIARARLASAGKAMNVPVRLLFAGRLDRGKGAAVAVEALASLQAGGLEALLDVAGDGVERAVLEALSRRLGVDEHVDFLGWLGRDALDERYAAAHLLLLPSRTEGQPKVLAEAMAFGCVPVVTDVGAAATVVAQAGCGRIVEPGSQAFADAVRHYAAHPGQWAEESARGRTAAAAATYDVFLERVRALLPNVP